MDQQTSNPKFVKYIWWKEIVMGPFLPEQLEQINWEKLEDFVDKALKTDTIKRVKPLCKWMEEHPNEPHILHDFSNGT